MTGYRMLESTEIKNLQDGAEVIVERKHWEYKTGKPKESTFYRAVAGHHMTCAGIAVDLEAEPNLLFPEFPSWQGKIYAENSGITQLWIKEE